MANTGIMHITATPGGQPFCRTNRSIMVTTVKEAAGWSRICAKCQAKLDKRTKKERAA